MCGRYALDATPQELSSDFRLMKCADFPRRFNVAPLQSVPVIRERPNGERVAHLLRWGLLPAWAKDESLAGRLMSARAETVADKPAFRVAFRARRCLIPASGYFEWATTPGGKQPYYIHPTLGALVTFAGLWERWTRPDGEPLDTFSVITTEANDATRAIHERMPAILPADAAALWLSREATPEQLQELLHPAAKQELAMYRVSRIVGSVKNDAPICLEPDPQE